MRRRRNSNWPVSSGASPSFLFCVPTRVWDSCFADNQIGAVGAVALASALESNQTLQEMNFRCKWRGLWRIAMQLGSMRAGCFVCPLTVNQIGDDGAKALADALHINKSATIIDLTSMRSVESREKRQVYERHDAQTIPSASKAPKRWPTRLPTTRRWFTFFCAVRHELAATTNKRFESLSAACWCVSDNEFGVEGAGALADALKSNTSLRHIDLACKLHFHVEKTC